MLFKLRETKVEKNNIHRSNSQSNSGAAYLEAEFSKLSLEDQKIVAKTMMEVYNAVIK